MTAAARNVVVTSRQAGKGHAAKVAKALGAGALGVFARMAAMLMPARHHGPRGGIRVTRDFGQTWVDWPPEGYGVQRDAHGRFVSC